ncbi:unnamed protein product [Allacma fusca]|uniref:Uncharacterized protein n=1 Tax=Allacma fusca TaxID=39272 RepID=A0A8J2PG93_9HEXA|nr:unnamed protein product [Allacma fusca]
MKYAVIFPGLLVVVWANLAKSHLTGVPEDETGARKESSEHPWDFVMPRPFYLTSPPNQEERPAVVKVPVDANVYYSAGIYNVHEISQSNLVAHPNSETPTFIPYIGARKPSSYS